MTLFNFGSINIDHFYEVDHLPEPGESIAATAYRSGLGGKGANQSVAAARAGARVCHIGAVGNGGEWARGLMGSFGVDTTAVVRMTDPNGHAIICVDRAGENSIVIVGGANRQLTKEHIYEGLQTAQPGDVLLLQNETSCQAEAARIGREKGLFVIYSASPFDVSAVRKVLPFVDMLVTNGVEAQQLQQALGPVDVSHQIITRGAKGASWQHNGEEITQAGFKVDVADTTGAGDCFLGSLAAMLDGPRETALRYAVAASALQVTQPGTAEAMPARHDVDAFLKAQ